jgi:hypothetical protein
MVESTVLWRRWLDRQERRLEALESPPTKRGQLHGLQGAGSAEDRA